MPKYIDVRCMAYNKDVFDEFGVDYPANFWRGLGLARTHEHGRGAYP